LACPKTTERVKLHIFGVVWNGNGLSLALMRDAPKLDMAALLRVDAESEICQYADDIMTG
jgi:hypothetical protein